MYGAVALLRRKAQPPAIVKSGSCQRGRCEVRLHRDRADIGHPHNVQMLSSSTVDADSGEQLVRANTAAPVEPRTLVEETQKPPRGVKRNSREYSARYSRG